MNAALVNLERRLTECLKDLTAADTQQHPPERWSVQQIVEHLILTYSATQAVVAGRIAKGRPTQATPSLLQHWSQFHVIRLGRFPHGVSAPDAVTPPTCTVAQSGNQLAHRAAGHLLAMDTSLHEASLLFGPHKRSVSHMLLGPLSPAHWRRFHLVHGLHHIGQIKETTHGQTPHGQTPDR